jgi:hypothetical protein
MSAAMAFTVYVAGSEMERSVTQRLRELCASYEVAPQITVVDVSANPEAAEQSNIVGVPTVVRESPQPRHRVIGALDDDRRVAEALAFATMWDETGGQR